MGLMFCHYFEKTYAGRKVWVGQGRADDVHRQPGQTEPQGGQVVRGRLGLRNTLAHENSFCFRMVKRVTRALNCRHFFGSGVS